MLFCKYALGNFWRYGTGIVLHRQDWTVPIGGYDLTHKQLVQLAMVGVCVLVCYVPYRVERLLAPVGLRLLDGHLVAWRFQLLGVKHASVTQRKYRRPLPTAF